MPDLFNQPDKPKDKSAVLRIYGFYPRQIGKGKALEAIEKALRSTKAEDLEKAVREYANSRYVKTAPASFIPHPSTWFNQRRWEDDRREWQRGHGDASGLEGLPDETQDEERLRKQKAQDDFDQAVTKEWRRRCKQSGYVRHDDVRAEMVEELRNAKA